VFTEADLQRSVPGLTVRESSVSNQLNFSIRGQTIDAFSLSQPGVLPYVNEVQISSLTSGSFYDLQSIQVLKGPQGTLFGRNTTGGAVLYTTAKPTDEFSGGVTVRYGNYSRKEAEAFINIPIIEDKFLIRAAGRFAQRNGYQRNLLTGLDQGPPDNGAEDKQSGRLSIMLSPTEQLKNETVVEISKSNDTSAQGVLYTLAPNGIVALAYSPFDFFGQLLGTPVFAPYVAAHPEVQAYPGGIAEFFATQQARGPLLAELNSPSFYRGRNRSVTNTTTFTASDALTIKNIFGYGIAREHHAVSTGGAPYSIFCNGPCGATIGLRTRNRQWSDELQAQGNAGDLKYILGAYYAYSRSETINPQNALALTPVFPGPGTTFAHFFQVNRSQALFAQGTYDLASVTGVQGLSFTGGIRYTWDSTRSVQLPDSDFFSPPLKVKFSKPSWTVGFEYQATPELLLYATHRGSWRSGGIQSSSPQKPGLADVGGSEFLPEKVKDVEVGVKYAGGPIRMNLAMYQQWIDDIQRVTYLSVANGSPFAVTANVPKAKVSGVELDGELRPTAWLTLGGAVAYTNARFAGNTNVSLGGTVTPFGPYADTPKWTGSAHVEIAFPVPERLGQVLVRAETYAQTKFYFSSTQGSLNPGAVLPGYSLTNLRLSWNDINGSNVSAAFFVNNVFDKTYYTGGLALESLLGFNTAIPGKPRMYAGELSVNF
jgi:iron complex outermembrane receptor protein